MVGNVGDNNGGRLNTGGFSVLRCAGDSNGGRVNKGGFSRSSPLLTARVALGDERGFFDGGESG